MDAEPAETRAPQALMVRIVARSLPLCRHLLCRLHLHCPICMCGVRVLISAPFIQHSCMSHFLRHHCLLHVHLFRQS